MQLAAATGVMANNGEFVIPRLLRGYGTLDDMQVVEPKYNQPVQVDKQSYWQVVHDAMVEVTSSIHGTAHSAFRHAPYTSAGKTGTAQVVNLGEDEEYVAEEVAEKYRDNAMYIGYAPAESPEVVIAVAIENVVGGGGSIAAPAARRLLDTWHKRYHPEQYEEVESAND